ncbi:unnamed protein product, partial [Brassica oleracea]
MLRLQMPMCNMWSDDVSARGTLILTKDDNMCERCLDQRAHSY